MLFVAFIVAWAGLQLVADAVRGEDSEDVTRIIGPMLLVAAVMVAPWGRTRPYFAYQFAALVGGTIAIWAMHAVQRIGRRRGWGPVQWLATIAAVGGIAGLVAIVVLGDNKANLLADASRISPFRRSGFVSEARPLMHRTSGIPCRCGASSRWPPCSPCWGSACGSGNTSRGRVRPGRVCWVSGR